MADPKPIAPFKDVRTFLYLARVGWDTYVTCATRADALAHPQRLSRTRIKVITVDCDVLVKTLERAAVGDHGNGRGEPGPDQLRRMLQVPSTSVDVQAFTYRITVEVTDFIVPLPNPREHDAYNVWASVRGAEVAVACPTDHPMDRTHLAFRVVASAPLPVGTTIEFMVTPSAT